MSRYVTCLRPFALAVLTGLLLGGVAMAQKGPKEKFSFPQLHKVEMPQVQKVVLNNGMKLYLVEDRQYPTIDLRAMVGVGSIYEPAEKLGLASITGTVLRTGGTETQTGDEIDRLLEKLGASVETGVGEGSGYVYVSVLKEDIDKGVEMLADILMHPAFRQDKIDLAKIEARSMISRRNDDIWSISNREYNSLIYGKASPYARYPEYATIEAINRDDIVGFYERYFHPNNIIFAAWGDFKASDLQKKLEAAFAKWPATKVELPPKPKVEYDFKYTVSFVQKSDVNQSHIHMGHIGGLMNNPDYPALTIMSQIFSYDRMFKVMRTKEGLTYAPWGYFGANYDHPGVFSCGTQTKSQSTVYAVRLMLKEVKRMTEEEVTDEELARAKDTYLNSFVFNFDSKAKIVNRLMTYAFYDYPLDFIERLKEGVEKVTKADVLRAAQKYLRPDQLQILVVGKKEDFDEPLTALGSVNEIDISIPMPKVETAPAATPESLEKGKALFDKAAEASGGLDAFRKIKNLWGKADLVQVTPMGEMKMEVETANVYPDRVYQSMLTPMGAVAMALVGEEGWMKSPQGTMPMQDAIKKNIKESLLRDPVFLFAHARGLRVQHLGERTFADGKAIDLLVAGREGTFHLYLDPVTNMPKGASYQTVGREGPANVEEVYSDYRDVSGVKMPFKTVASQDGKKVSETTFKEMRVNGPVDRKWFDKK